jgi:hypothetical protein
MSDIAPRRYLGYSVLLSGQARSAAGRETGWYAAQVDPETPDGQWQPYLQVRGHCSPLPIWFDTKTACESYIREHLSGAGMLEGATAEPEPDGQP